MKTIDEIAKLKGKFIVYCFSKHGESYQFYVSKSELLSELRSHNKVKHEYEVTRYTENNVYTIWL
jgi:hypothetical protein